MGHLRHAILAEGRRCRCGARRLLHIALQLEHLRGEHQVNGFMGCDCYIEQLHREGKQVTGLERCQCRKARIQRNHIGCALLVWVRLKDLATETGRTVYQLKHGLLDDYLTQQLRNPSLKMVLA